MVPGTIGKVFARIFFKWLCEWVWPSSNFYFAMIIQTSETRAIWKYYLEISLAPRYLLQQIFNECLQRRGTYSITRTKQRKNQQDGLLLVLRNARSLYSNGRVNLQVHALQRLLRTRQGCQRLFKPSIQLPAGSARSETMQKATITNESGPPCYTNSSAFQLGGSPAQFWYIIAIKDMMCSRIILRSFMGRSTKWKLL